MPGKREEILEGHARLARAPGRVNLIGEHTDYNGGLVLPAAIDRYIYVAFSPIEERRVEIYSVDFEERSEFWLGEPPQSQDAGWAAYVRGVAWALESSGYQLRGMVAALGGNVPIGAGLSSSAALEVATAMAFSDDLDTKPRKLEIALLCRKAENDFVGVNCGIMDQYASVFAEEGNSILLDCQKLDHRLVPIPPELEIIICDTGVRRELASSEYNKRRTECEEALLTLSQKLRPLENLSQLSADELPLIQKLLPDNTFNRVRHILTENARVIALADALGSADFEVVGRLMHQSHESLRLDYEVSSPELDAMVQAAKQVDGTVGARMTGAGFGGCTVNLVRHDAVQEFSAKVPQLFYNLTGEQAAIYTCKPAAGATVIRIEEGVT